MNTILNKKINIGISACQLGAKVRYNAKGFSIFDTLTREKYDYNWHPVCPEVLAGLGVPRSPIRIVSGNGNDVWNNSAHVKNKFGQIKTVQIKESSMQSFTQITNANCDAFIYMDGSPTCGISKVNNKPSGKNKAPGVFGALLVKSDIFLIPASDVYSPIKWWDHKRRMYVYVWLKETQINSKKDLLAVWDIITDLIEEINPLLSKLLEKDLNNYNNLDYVLFKNIITNELKKQQSIESIKRSMWKNMQKTEQKHNIKNTSIKHPDIIRGSNALVAELTTTQRLLSEQNINFLLAPIIYSPK